MSVIIYVTSNKRASGADPEILRGGWLVVLLLFCSLMGGWLAMPHHVLYSIVYKGASGGGLLAMHPSPTPPPSPPRVEGQNVDKE